MKLAWHKEFIYSVTFARRHTQTRSHSGTNSLMYEKDELPHMFSLSTHISQSHVYAFNIKCFTYKVVLHIYALGLACQAEVESSQFEESDFCHKVHLKRLKVPSCQLAH